MNAPGEPNKWSRMFSYEPVRSRRFWRILRVLAVIIVLLNVVSVIDSVVYREWDLVGYGGFAVVVGIASIVFITRWPLRTIDGPSEDPPQ